MKSVIVIKSGSCLIGVYTNFKKFWDTLENRESKQHYATVMLSLRYGKDYDLGECIIQGDVIENVHISKITVNTLRAH
jgi:hypothetical protein